MTLPTSPLGPRAEGFGSVPASPGPIATKPDGGRRLRRWLAAGAALVVVGGAAAGASRLAAGRTSASVHYETAAIDRGPLDAKVTATGIVSAIITVQVGSQVSGRIQRLLVDFSSPVKRGQVIATIDPALFEAAVEQARAAHLQADAGLAKSRAAKLQADRQLTRLRLLHRDGLASQSDLDVAEAAVWSAEADVKAAQANLVQTHAAQAQAQLSLSYATIVSPIDGVVISRNVDVGQTVAAALQAPTLFTIAQDLTKMQVDTNVAEADVGKLREGMGVTFTVDAYPGRAFPGRVRQVRDAATTTQNVVTYDAVIDFENSQRLLKPGMTATATFVYAHRDDVLRVPNAALRFRPDAATTLAMTGAPPSGAGRTPAKGSDRFVWVLRGTRAASERVTIGITDGTSTEVAGGDLRDGDAAVTEALADAPASKR